MKLEIVNYNNFKHLLENFVPDNFSVDGCRECNENCNEVVPNDFSDGKYDCDLKEIYIKMIKR